MSATEHRHQVTGCEGEKHNEHLCYLQYTDYHVRHRKDYKVLVQKAEFICRNCGRTAQHADNLCVPEPL